VKIGDAKPSLDPRIAPDRTGEAQEIAHLARMPARPAPVEKPRPSRETSDRDTELSASTHASQHGLSLLAGKATQGVGWVSARRRVTHRLSFPRVLVAGYGALRLTHPAGYRATGWRRGEGRPARAQPSARLLPRQMAPSSPQRPPLVILGLVPRIQRAAGGSVRSRAREFARERVESWILGTKSEDDAGVRGKH
jgi:hypothetical protein